MKKTALYAFSIFICITLLLAILPVVSACSGGGSTPSATPSATTSPAAAGKSNILIGFSTPVTGVYAAGGESQLNAFMLWQDYVNEKGGIMVKELGKSLPVKLVYYDDKSDPSQAISIYERLITQDKVDFLLGNWGTQLQTAVIPTIEKYKVPCVGNDSGSITWKDLKASYFWGLGTTDDADIKMPGLVELMTANKDQIKNVAILYCNDVRPLEDMSILKPLLEKNGFNIVLQKDYPIGVTDLSSVLLQVKDAKPDAVIGLSYPADTILMGQQAIGLGVNAKLWFNLVGPGISAFKNIFADASNGIIFMGGWTEKGPGDSKIFYDRYLAKFKMPPDYLDSVNAWQSGEILQQAIQNAGSLDREKVRQQLATSTFSTIWGPVKFEGVMVKDPPHSLLQWQNGQVEMIWPPEKQTAKPLLPKPVWPAPKPK